MSSSAAPDQQRIYRYAVATKQSGVHMIYHKHRPIPETLKNDICAFYADGHSLTYTSKKLGVSTGGIRGVLGSRGIKVRSTWKLSYKCEKPSIRGANNPQWKGGVKYDKAYQTKRVVARARERRATDALYKLRHNLRARHAEAFKQAKIRKPSSINRLLGASMTVVFAHIGKQFMEGMSWANHGLWEIDHKVPLASAANARALVKLMHYRNLQPLWKAENLAKGSRVVHDRDVNASKNILKFAGEHPRPISGNPRPLGRGRC